MATHLRRRWSARFEGMSRRERRGCDYDAYLPDPLMGWNLNVTADVAADVADPGPWARTHLCASGQSRPRHVG